MTLNELMKYLKANLSHEAKVRLKKSLDTVNVCGEPHWIKPEQCMKELGEYNHLLKNRIEHIMDTEPEDFLTTVRNIYPQISTNKYCLIKIQEYVDSK